MNVLRNLNGDGSENQDVVEKILLLLFFLAFAIFGYFMANYIGL